MRESSAYGGGRTAVVAGATGLVGRELVRQLLEESAYSKVIALVRRTTGMEHPHLEERLTDFDRLEAAAGDFAGADLFCALGTTIKKAGSQELFRKVDFDYPLRLAELGKQEGIRSYSLVSAMGANARSGIFYNRVKGEAEERIAALGLRAVFLFRPSLLLGERDEFRRAERFASAAAKPLSWIFAGPLRKYKPVEGAAVAAAMIASALPGNAGVHILESDEIARVARLYNAHHSR